MKRMNARLLTLKQGFEYSETETFSCQEKQGRAAAKPSTSICQLKLCAIWTFLGLGQNNWIQHQCRDSSLASLDLPFISSRLAETLSLPACPPEIKSNIVRIIENILNCDHNLSKHSQVRLVSSLVTWEEEAVAVLRGDGRLKSAIEDFDSQSDVALGVLAKLWSDSCQQLFVTCLHFQYCFCKLFYRTQCVLTYSRYKTKYVWLRNQLSGLGSSNV